MENKMSKHSKKEMILVLRERYKTSTKRAKSAILDTCVQTAGYSRKYATIVLNRDAAGSREKKTRPPKYGEDVEEVLIKAWNICNRICGKRLAPFLPELMRVLERGGHLNLTDEVREKVLSISPATIDRLLAKERKRIGFKSFCSTKPGRVLKNQIPIRTFADWTESQPGFLEADCVAHCGGSLTGPFINTLTVTDICTCWTEFRALERKVESAVAAALSGVAELFPFPIKGLDTDNGSEFINYVVNAWCKDGKVTFTRARPYKKNDQAHVEEKNGSVIRQFVGHDRYSGADAQKRMNSLYDVLRLYVNFFQPSMKLTEKVSYGGKLRKRYDIAKTPYQRVLESDLDEELKNKLRAEYDRLDIVTIKEQVESLQKNLWLVASMSDGDVQETPTVYLPIPQAEPENKIERIANSQLRIRKRIGKPKVNRPNLDHHLEKDRALNMRELIDTFKKGRIIQSKEFRNFGSYAFVCAVLTRLTEQEKLTRIEKGRYIVSSAKPCRARLTTRLQDAIKLEDGTFTADKFLHLAPRHIVSTLLSRMRAEGKIERVTKGEYKKLEPHSNNLDEATTLSRYDF